MGHRLTPAEIEELRRMLKEGAKPSDLAARYGVSESTIHANSGEHHEYTPKVAALVPLVIPRLAAGESQSAIARDLGINQNLVSRIQRREEAAGNMAVLPRLKGPPPKAKPTNGAAAPKAVSPPPKKPTPTVAGLGPTKLAIIRALARVGKTDGVEKLQLPAASDVHSIGHLMDSLRQQGIVKFRVNRISPKVRRLESMELTPIGMGIARQHNFLPPVIPGSAIFRDPMDAALALEAEPRVGKVEVARNGAVTVLPRTPQDQAEREFYAERVTPEPEPVTAEVTTEVQPEPEPVTAEVLPEPEAEVQPEAEPVTVGAAEELLDDPDLLAGGFRSRATVADYLPRIKDEAARNVLPELTAEEWPLLAALRVRRMKAERRAALLEEAAELAESDEEFTQLVDLAHKTREGVQYSPLEREYLRFATRKIE